MQFTDDLRDMGFTSCKTEPDIWMRKSGDLWEYVAVYVDDLAFVVQNPEEFIKKLENNYKHKLKGTGSISFHFGCDFFRDKNGTLYMASRKYIDRMIDDYKNICNEKPPSNYKSPLEKRDHPELDNTGLLDPSEVPKKSIIDWLYSVGYFS